MLKSWLSPEFRHARFLVLHDFVSRFILVKVFFFFTTNRSQVAFPRNRMTRCKIFKASKHIILLFFFAIVFNCTFSRVREFLSSYSFNECFIIFFSRNPKRLSRRKTIFIAHEFMFYLIIIFSRSWRYVSGLANLIINSEGKPNFKQSQISLPYTVHLYMRDWNFQLRSVKQKPEIKLNGNLENGLKWSLYGLFEKGKKN